MAFHWSWDSKTGTTRKENQDYAGIALQDEFLFAVVADGVSARENSGELARDLTTCLIDRAIAIDETPTCRTVAQWVADAFGQLPRKRVPPTSTSFIAACFSRDQLKFTVHAGDCRIGVRNALGKVEWKTPVHSIATAIKPLDEALLRGHPMRNQLTRTFGTKRFKAPELIDFGCKYPGGAAIATDGFWAGLPLEVQHEAFNTNWQATATCDDDVSRLLIQWDEGKSMRTETAQNFYVRTRQTFREK